MKRSAVNQAIAWPRTICKKTISICPNTPYWPLETWKANAGKLDTVRKVMLGWDITDYGLNDFEHIGSVLYTVRNGSIEDKNVGVPFCEKYIVMRDGQRLTNHYHVAKTEDIINRAGGTLRLYLWKVDPATGKMTDEDVDVYMDGVLHTFKAGEEVLVEPGNSISLTPYIAHHLRPQARQRPSGGRSLLHQRRQHRQLLPRRMPALHHHRGRRAHGLPPLQRIRQSPLTTPQAPRARPPRRAHFSSPFPPFPAPTGSRLHRLPTPPPPRLHRLPTSPAPNPTGSHPTGSQPHRLHQPPTPSTPPALPAPISPPRQCSVPPSPKTPQADGPCSWAVRRVHAPPPNQKRNKAPMPPARGAWARVHGAKGTGRGTAVSRWGGGGSGRRRRRF